MDITVVALSAHPAKGIAATPLADRIAAAGMRSRLHRA